MRILASLVVGVLGAVAFAIAASPASASTIRLNASGYTGVAARTLTLDPGGLSIHCDVSFVLGARSTSVTAAVLPATLASFGTVTGRPGPCDGGFVLTLLGVPWVTDITVSGGPGNVTGTTRLLVRNVQFERSNSTLRCLYQGDVPVSLNAAGTIASINTSLPLAIGSIFCPSPGRLVGTVALSPAVVVTLS